jgi:DNA protecting protein DprA
MNLLKLNDIEQIIAFGIIPYEILTHQQKVNLLFSFDFDIKKIFNADIKQIKSILKKKDSFKLDLKEYFIKAKEIVRKKNFITADSEYFPFDCWKKDDTDFKQCQILPFLLFYEGDPKILSLPKISIVGTRRPDEISIEFTSHVVKNLKKVVVSGFANGIDHYSHLFAIENNIPTIAVFGCGVNIIYPKSNLELYRRLKDKQYLILSEFADDTIPKKYYFPIRNRIIAALGEKLLCVQAGKKSGALITTRYAKELNKNIYVFYPYEQTGFEGNKNLFLSNEASLLYGVYNGKIYLKNPISLIENIEKNTANINTNLGTSKNEGDNTSKSAENEVEFQYKIDDSDDFVLFKEIFDSPNRRLEYYIEKIGKDVRTTILSYESLLSKNLIKIDKSNRIYPNYLKDAIKLIVK